MWLAFRAPQVGRALPRGAEISIFEPVTAESELAAFTAEFAPEIYSSDPRVSLRLLARFPDAVQLVYDNYNLMVIGGRPVRSGSGSDRSTSWERYGGADAGSCVG